MGLLVLNLHLLRAIGLPEDDSAGPKYTKTKYTQLMHLNKNHHLVLISLVGSEI